MATPLPLLTRDQIAAIFKDPTQIRAYDALQRALQYVPVDIDVIGQQASDALAAAQAARDEVEALQDVAFVTMNADPALPNERALAVAAALTLLDGGAGASVTLGLNPDHVNVFTKNQSTRAVQLVDAASVSVAASQSNVFRLLTTSAVGSTRALAAPTDLTDGMVLAFLFQQPAAGGPCALTFASIYDFGPAGVPSLSAAANAIDLMLGVYDGVSGKIECVFRTGVPICFQIAISDLVTALTTGTNNGYFDAPYAFTITEVIATVLTASTSGLPQFDVKKNGTTIFSTKVTIDANETSSLTAATPPVITTTAIAKGDRITIDIVTAGTGTKGAQIAINGTKP